MKRLVRSLFNYQTNGMCVLSHCIKKAYGLYNVAAPEGSPKIVPLYQTKIADVIEAHWGYTSRSQKMHEKARLNIFGWGTAIQTSTTRSGPPGLALVQLGGLGWSTGNPQTVVARGSGGCI